MSTPEEIIASMQSELDEAIKTSVNIDEELDNELIPTGIDYLDLLLGGGIATKSLTLIAGDPGTFKSTLAGNICAAFKRKYQDTLVLYLDSENAMTPSRLQQLGLQGIKPRSNLTVEKVFSAIQALMMFKEDKKIKDVPAIVVWDSIANTPTEAELTATSVNETIGLKARTISTKLPVIINKLSEYNITLIFINQFREKIQMGVFHTANDLRHLAHDKTLPGGNSPKFNASQFLQLRVSRIFDHTNSPYGFRATMVKVKTIKNKFFPDGYEIELLVDPSKGFDNLYTNWELLKLNKKCVAGAWSYLKSYPDKKFQGVRNLRPTYETHKEFREAFDKAVKETIEEMRFKMSNFQVVKTSEDDNVTVQDDNNSNQDGNVQEQESNQTQSINETPVSNLIEQK